MVLKAMVLQEKMSVLVCTEIFVFFVYAILKHIAVSTVKYIYIYVYISGMVF